VKNKFYTSFLLIGVGLAMATTSSHAKPAHAAHKKTVSVTVAKHGKKLAKVSAPAPVKVKHTPVKHPQKPLVTAAIKQIRHGKSSGLMPVKYVVARSNHSQRIHSLISGLKNAHKKHPQHHAHNRFFSKRKPHRAGRTYLEKVLPPLTEEEVNIPYLPSENPFIDTETDSPPAENPFTEAASPPAETNARIHAFIPADNRGEAVIERTDDATHNYSAAHGTITSTLADAGAEAGLSEELLTQLTHIFAWDIDFATRLSRGDQFTVVYESNGLDDEHIIAAEFATEGRILTAVRYEDDDGNVNYYTPEGKVMRKAFLSTPVDYARITSHFDINRRHPILNRIRAHKGVDYAARTGTPIKATGDGEIAFMGNKGGYGQVIIIQHGEHYETLYAHLSDFKSNLLEGDAVSQGDIIGYVGQTGLATGPHLHYEFRVDGVHRNPETSASRNELALNSALLPDFKQQTRTALAQLYSAKAQTLLAKNQPFNR
jgi:murein DD-endopeptidase MepM/ murein hydrolase activator NlpD